jgi:hypothetical protein
METKPPPQKIVIHVFFPFKKIANMQKKFKKKKNIDKYLNLLG